MLCYLDKTFCDYYLTCKKGENCNRALYKELEEKAHKAGLPLSRFLGHPSCFRKIKVKK